MVIVFEKNSFEEGRGKIRKIKSLWYVKLPRKYYLEEGEKEMEIRYRSLLGSTKIAEVRVAENIITVSFNEEESYKELRDCFKDSKTKFNLIVNNSYY